MWRRLSVLALLGAASCSAADFTKPGPLSQPTAYNALFPYSVELCAVSQIDKKPALPPFISGGPGGHSVMFLRGTCLAQGQHYPVLSLCDGRSNPPDGVGLSVNAHYSNANWIGTEGSGFFFNGTRQPDERLSRPIYDETQREAERRGIFDGIKFHDYVFKGKPAAISRVDWMYEMSVSTDYAVDFGRGRICSRVPVTREQMSDIIGFLNAKNAVYRSARSTFQWSVLRDNCAHLTHNALAAAGFWPAWPTDRPTLISAFDFPVPKNEFVNLMRRAEPALLVDPARVFRNATLRRQLIQANWLPAEPGVLDESEGPAEGNDIYNTKLKLIFYDDPVFGSYQPHYDRYRREPRYHNLTANLVYFDALYGRIQAERRPLSWWQQTHPSLARSPDDFPAFYMRFYAYVASQRTRVEAGLRNLQREPSTPYSAAAGRGAVAAGAPLNLALSVSR